jgi:hypothetical protein
VNPNDDSQIVPILSRFPGPVTLYPSKTKWLSTFLGCLGFSIIGIWLIEIGNRTWMDWSALIFFSLGVILIPIALLPGASVLTLDADGFQFINLFRRCRYSWVDTTGFVSWAVTGRTKMVLFNMPIPDSRVAKGFDKVARALSGHDGGLPDTYGLSAENLAQLMTRWRERAIASGSRCKT